MSSQLKTYKIRDFIRKDASGALDLERSKTLARELAAVAGIHTDHNLLLDLRDTTVILGDMSQVIAVVSVFAQSLRAFPGKIASIIPSDPRRENYASMVASLMQLRDVNYRYFTDYEAAIEWLADVETFREAE